MKKISPQAIAEAAILVALEIVLNRLVSINTLGLKIGLSFVPVALGAMVLGPYYAAIIGGMADFIGALLIPLGPYHPGFTVCAMIMGFTYGLFLYQNKSGIFSRLPKWNKIRFFPNILLPILINCLILGLLINTIWVSQLYGSKTYWGWFTYRLSQYLVLVPLNLILLPILLPLSAKIKKLSRISA